LFAVGKKMLFLQGSVATRQVEADRTDTVRLYANIDLVRNPITPDCSFVVAMDPFSFIATLLYTPSTVWGNSTAFVTSKHWGYVWAGHFQC